MNEQQKRAIVVMGVSGCGKSSIGKKLAQALGGIFEDADDFHPAANIEKMTNRIPLTDEDRWPWLEILRKQIVQHQENNNIYVLACSALKQSYRDLLAGNDSPESLIFVYLKGTKELITKRMKEREHFMPVALLDSQFATLEEPLNAIVVDIELTQDEIVKTILNQLKKVNF